MKKYIKETFKYVIRSNIVISPFIKEIERLYSLSEKELYEESEVKFLKIFRKAINKSPFYKKLYAEYGIYNNDVQSLSDISKLPIIDRQMVNQDPTKLLTIPKFFMSKSHTSGTTGTPLTVYHDYFSVLREQSYLYVFRKRRGFTYGDKLVSLRGNLGRDLFKLKVGMSNTLYLSSYQINQNTIKKYYDEILSFAPFAIEGYPSSLYNLCCFFKEKGWKLSIPKCFTSSETLFDFQRNAIEETLNTELYDNYGNTERTISLNECFNHKGYFSQPGYSINEFQDDCVVTTSLINSSFPLIRYKVDDVILLNPVPSFANSELCKVKSIEGRIDDSIITKDGSLITRLGHLFKDIKNVKMAQIIQEEKGSILINIVPENDFMETDIKKLMCNIDQRIGLDNIKCDIKLVDYSKIIYTNRNKFKLIVSLIN